MSLPELNAQETVERMRRYHIRNMVVSSTLALSYDVREGNQQVVDAVARHSELLGYAVLDPHDVTGAAEELARCLRHDGVVGVKLHPRLSGKPTGSDQFAALFEQIAPYRCPVLIHNDGADYAAAILQLARAHPQLPIIIAHAGPSRPDEAAFNAAAQAENLYLEFATTFPWRGAVRRAIETAGVERVLFGSDFPLIDPGYVLGHYQEAALSDDEQQAIMWQNAEKLFSRR
jgi:predicted TIM-barrel fold metal-dependent hydrolase